VSGRVEMVEYWVLGDWQIVQWKYVPVNPVDVGEEWFTYHGRTVAEPDCDDSRYASLYEAMLVVASAAYVDHGVEDLGDAQWLAFRFARQIGMHRWDGEEWVHTAPGER
jgi:hypothetical protein